MKFESYDIMSKWVVVKRDVCNRSSTFWWCNMMLMQTCAWVLDNFLPHPPCPPSLTRSQNQILRGRLFQPPPPDLRCFPEPSLTLASKGTGVVWCVAGRNVLQYTAAAVPAGHRKLRVIQWRFREDVGVACSVAKQARGTTGAGLQYTTIAWCDASMPALWIAWQVTKTWNPRDEMALVRTSRMSVHTFTRGSSQGFFFACWPLHTYYGRVLYLCSIRPWNLLPAKDVVILRTVYRRKYTHIHMWDTLICMYKCIYIYIYITVYIYTASY